MTQTVKAVLIEENGGPEVIKMADVELLPPGPDQVTIRQKAVGLNFIDIYCRTGLYPSALPHGLGFEAAGVIEAIGSNVTNFKIGDRVAYGQSPLGAYTEARNVPAFQVVKIPDSLSFEQAAAVILKGLTVQYLFRQTYQLEAGQTVLFHAAAGGVGLIACQWAKALGVNLIGTTSSPEKAALAKEYGAWQIIDYTKEDVAKRVLELTDGKKVPVVYDGVGKQTWPASLDSVAPRGLIVSFGNASGAVEGVNLGVLSAKGSIYVTRPTLGHYVDTQEKMQAAADELFELVLNGKIKINIGQRFPLEQAADAQIALASRQTTGATVLTL